MIVFLYIHVMYIHISFMHVVSTVEDGESKSECFQSTISAQLRNYKKKGKVCGLATCN